MPATLLRLKPQRAPAGEDDAPLVLFETLYAMPATLLRLKQQRGLAAGTARQHDIPHRQVDGGPSCRGGHILFSQEKDAKVIQGGGGWLPHGLPL